MSSAGLPNSRDRLIQAAAALFYERGIHRTSVDIVAERAGLSKPTLYKYFPSKDELITAVAEYRSEAWHRGVDERVGAAESPRDRLLGVFDFLVDFVEVESFRGCALVNAAVEIHLPSGPGREVARANKLHNRQRLMRLAGAAGVPDPAALASTLALLFEGAISSAYVEGDVAAGRVARQAAEALIDQALARS